MDITKGYTWLIQHTGHIQNHPHHSLHHPEIPHIMCFQLRLHTANKVVQVQQLFF